jgi:alcohol dehydrogenase class IV
MSGTSFAYTSNNLSDANSLAGQDIIKEWGDAPVNYRFDDKIARSEIMGMALAMAGITRNTNCRGDFADVPKSSMQIP